MNTRDAIVGKIGMPVLAQTDAMLAPLRVITLRAPLEHYDLITSPWFAYTEILPKRERDRKRRAMLKLQALCQT